MPHSSRVIDLLLLIIFFFSTKVVFCEEQTSVASREEENEAFQYLQIEYPYKINGFLQLKVDNLAEYYSVVRKLLAEKKHMEYLSKSDPIAYQNRLKLKEIDKQVWLLAQRYEQIEDHRLREKINLQMHQLLSELFDLQEAQKSEEIMKLEQKLKELRDISNKRKKNKDTIIESRLSDIQKGKIVVD